MRILLLTTEPGQGARYLEQYVRRVWQSTRPTPPGRNRQCIIVETRLPRLPYGVECTHTQLALLLRCTACGVSLHKNYISTHLHPAQPVCRRLLERRAHCAVYLHRKDFQT